MPEDLNKKRNLSSTTVLYNTVVLPRKVTSIRVNPQIWSEFMGLVKTLGLEASSIIEQLISKWIMENRRQARLDSFAKEGKTVNINIQQNFYEQTINLVKANLALFNPKRKLELLKTVKDGEALAKNLKEAVNLLRSCRALGLNDYVEDLEALISLCNRKIDELLR